MMSFSAWVRLAVPAVLAAVLLLPPAAAAPVETFTLNEALATAYDTNPELDAQRADLRATDEGVAQANANWRPTVNLQGSYSWTCNNYSETTGGFGQPNPSGSCKRNQVTEYSPLTGQLTVTQPIFRGGQTWAEVGRAKAQVHVGRAQLALTEENVLLDTATAYMDVVRDTQTVLLEEQNVAALEQQLKDTQTEASVGEQTKADVEQAQARLASAQSDLASVRSRLVTSRATFEQTVGRSAETLERMPKMPPLPSSLDFALQIAETENPNMIGARANEQAAQYQVNDAEGALMPQAGVQAQYQYSKGSPNFFGALGTNRGVTVVGQVTVPIYQGGGDEATVRRAKELHSEAMIQIAQADAQVRQAVQAAWASYQAAKASIASSQAAVDANRAAYEGVKEQWKLGDRTTIDVLNAEQELFQAQVSLVNAQHDMLVGAYQILSATGQLNAKYLALRVNYYDPLVHYNDDASAWFGFGN